MLKTSFSLAPTVPVTLKPVVRHSLLPADPQKPLAWEAVPEIFTKSASALTFVYSLLASYMICEARKGVS